MLVYIIVFMLGYAIGSIAVSKKPIINYKADVIRDKECAYRELELFIGKNNTLLPDIIDVPLREMSFNDISLIIKAYNIYHEGLVKRSSDSLCFIFSFRKKEVFKQIDENIFREGG